MVRTCECFGVQDIHIIESRSKYGTNLKVLKGSHYWLNLVKHKKEKPSVVYNNLKSQGHKISVTSVSAASQSIFDIDPVAIGNVALVMGNELHGIAKETKELVDYLVHIPMVGFTESFNVSVSAVICIAHLVNKIRQSDLDWKLTDHDKDEIRMKWVKLMVKKSEVLERNFLKMNR